MTEQIREELEPEPSEHRRAQINGTDLGRQGSGRPLVKKRCRPLTETGLSSAWGVHDGCLATRLGVPEGQTCKVI